MSPKCDLCDAEATVHEVSLRNKVRIERHLCEHCAVRLGLLSPDAAGIAPEFLPPDAGEAAESSQGPIFPLSYLSPAQPASETDQGKQAAQREEGEQDFSQLQPHAGLIKPQSGPQAGPQTPAQNEPKVPAQNSSGNDKPPATSEQLQGGQVPDIGDAPAVGPTAGTPGRARTDITQPLGHTVANIKLENGGQLSISIGVGAPPAPGTFPPTNGRASKCHGCGLTFADFKQHAVLGCSECYKCFEHLISPLIERAHEGGISHTGKQPRRLVNGGQPAAKAVPLAPGLSEEDRLRRLQSLQAQLSRAVNAEQYELAAKVRDEIRRLASLHARSAPHQQDAASQAKNTPPHADQGGPAPDSESTS